MKIAKSSWNKKIADFYQTYKRYSNDQDQPPTVHSRASNPKGQLWHQGKALSMNQHANHKLKGFFRKIKKCNYGLPSRPQPWAHSTSKNTHNNMKNLKDSSGQVIWSPAPFINDLRPINSKGHHNWAYCNLPCHVKSSRQKFLTQSSNNSSSRVFKVSDTTQLANRKGQVSS